MLVGRKFHEQSVEGFRIDKGAVDKAVGIDESSPAAKLSIDFPAVSFEFCRF